MSFSGVSSSLGESSKLFDDIVSRREKLIKESRDVIAISARAIVSVHTNDLEKAYELNKQAKERLAELRKVAEDDLTKYVLTPEQEFVESSVLLALRNGESIPSRKKLGVSNLAYILGLLDAVGELKRAVYDAIRKADFEKAEKFFGVMEHLYLLLSPFAAYDNVAQGVKRKLDVARAVIEDARATITEEARRLEFIKAVNKLSQRIQENNTN